MMQVTFVIWLLRRKFQIPYCLSFDLNQVSWSFPDQLILIRKGSIVWVLDTWLGPKFFLQTIMFIENLSEISCVWRLGNPSDGCKRTYLADYLWSMEQKTVVQRYTSMITSLKAYKGNADCHTIYSLVRLLAVHNWCPLVYLVWRYLTKIFNGIVCKRLFSS